MAGIGRRSGSRAARGWLRKCEGAGPAAAAPIVSRGVALREPAADARPYAAADTAFGLSLLGASCRADPRANLVFSPASLASGLGMAYLGARGGTARAMASVLHLPAVGGQALEAGLQARSASLRRLAGPGVTLAGSDRVWADPSLPALRSYLTAVATGYGAGVTQVPLLSLADQAVQEIDSAIAASTRGQIPRLLSSLDGAAWVLTDALYLHAAWAAPFDASQTSLAAFSPAAGLPVSASYLHGGAFRYARAGGWTAVRIPYRGRRGWPWRRCCPIQAAGAARRSARRPWAPSPPGWRRPGAPGRAVPA